MTTKRPRRRCSKETARKISQTLSNKTELSWRELVARVPQKDYLSNEEVAEVFDVHPVTVYKWVGDGSLRAYRVKARGRTNLYRREDVLALIEARYKPRPASPRTHDDRAEESEKTPRKQRRKASKKKGKAKG